MHTLNDFYDMSPRMNTMPSFVAAYANKVLLHAKPMPPFPLAPFSIPSFPSRHIYTQVTSSSVPASASMNISETYSMTFPASIHFQKHMDTIAASTDVSCIFKVDPDFGNVLALWQAAKQVVLGFEAQGKMPLNSFMAMRFVRGSQVNLSPFKGDPSKDVFAAIEVSSGHGALDFTQDLTKEDSESFVEQLFDAWAAIEDVRAFWVCCAPVAGAVCVCIRVGQTSLCLPSTCGRPTHLS